MAERSKVHLKQEFRDGERPTGEDFSDLIDSFICKMDDSVSIDANQNLKIPGGVNLGNPTTGQPGTIRYNGSNVQVFDGGTWNSIAGGGGGVFALFSGGPNAVFAGGNVGIGTFGSTPTFKLEVPLGQNTLPADRVKFGNVALGNGQAALQGAAQFSHSDQAVGNSNFALRQNANGEVILNAPTGQPITISHGRTNARIFVAATTGQVVIGSNATLAGSTAAHMLQVNGDVAKQGGANTWTILSDIRLKRDIRPFSDGLEKLLKIRPVSFRYNGLLDTNTEKQEVGIIGQEMQQLFPYMITGEINEKDKDKQPQPGDEVLMYNGSALTYVMVNAIQELSQKVNELEAKLNALTNANATA